MPKPSGEELRRRAVEHVRSGRPATEVSHGIGISRNGLHAWVRQDRIDHGEITGWSTTENAEPTQSLQRIRELEGEVEVLKIARNLLGEDKPGSHCHLDRLTASTHARRDWPTGLIGEVDAASHGT